MALLPSLLLLLLAAAAPPPVVTAQLSPRFYVNSCPGVETLVRSAVASAVAADPRMGASLLRLHFHDCFVNGCDGSILLDDTANFTGEKSAGPNVNSVRGYDVIDAAKAAVEKACNATVSCADIVALAARDAVNLLGGPSWAVPLGRRDALTASQSAANANLPGPGSTLAALRSTFAAQGLTAREMTVLSGAHTVGRARCQFFRSRIYAAADITVDASFAALRQQTCPQTGGDANLAPNDVTTPDVFDNAYFRNLVDKRGLFPSDQALAGGAAEAALVRLYASNGDIFALDFARAMVRMGSVNALTGSKGEVRRNCRRVNS